MFMIDPSRGSCILFDSTKGINTHRIITPIETEKIIIKNFPNNFREIELFTRK